MRASRPTFARKAAPVPFGRALAAVCRGGPWPSRKTPRRRKAPGPMQASAPTEVCYNAEGAASRSAACPPLAVGADSISARGVCGGAEPPGRYRIGPDRGLLCREGAASRLAAMFPALRRAGVYARRTAAISRGVRAAARSGGMRASRPTFARKVVAAPFGRALAAVRRGGPWPSRKAPRRRKLPGPMRASAPTDIKRGMRLPALRRPVTLTRNRTKNAPAQTRRGRQNAAARLTCTLRSCS